MIKLLFLIVAFIAFLLIKLITAGVGFLGVMVDKRGTFVNHARQYLKYAPISYATLSPYLARLVDMVFEYSKERNYKLADEIDVLEASLHECVMRIANNELNLLPYNNRPLPVADGFIVATNFMNENNIETVISPTKNANNCTEKKNSQIVYDMINIQKIEECARDMRAKENITYNESIYFAITSLCAFLISSPVLKTESNIQKLTKIVEDNFPQMSPLIAHAISGGFDFVEHIAYNAKIIVKDEKKTPKEATYLAICTFYDDLKDKNSTHGIKELMQIVQIIYPELSNEIMTYIAWKYDSNLVFGADFDEEMEKRHS